MKSNCKNIWSKWIKRVSLGIIVATIPFLCTTNMAYGANNYQKSNFLDRNSVYKGSSNYIPSSSEYPLNSNPTSINFATLYDDQKDFFQYLGEVPLAMKDEKFAKDFPCFGSDLLNGQQRLWASTTMDEATFDSSDDIHLVSMGLDHSTSTFSSICFSILNGLNGLISNLVNVVIFVKTLDINAVVGQLDKNGNFIQMLSSIFLVDTKTNVVSPILFLSIIAFIASLISIGFKIAKGDLRFRPLLKELSIFVGAAALSGLFLTGSNVTKLNDVSINVVDTLSANIIIGSNESSSLFENSTDDKNMDTLYNQAAMVQKTYIDQMIGAQFDCNITDLYLVNPDGSDGSFGDKVILSNAIKSAFGEDAGTDFFAVSNQLDGTQSINNLGYYLWAANSNVATSTNANGVYSNDGSIKTAGNSRVLFVMDFLNELRKEYVDVDAHMVNKIDHILSALNKPNYGKASGTLLLLCLQNAVLIYALSFTAIFCLLGEIVVVLGSFCMVVMPPLMLFSKTRDMAKQLVFTYLMGFLRYVVGNALFNIILVMSSIISQNGMAGIIISTILCFVLARFSPKLISELNKALSKFGAKNHELAPVTQMYAWGNERSFRNHIDKQRAYSERKKSQSDSKKQDPSNGEEQAPQTQTERWTEEDINESFKKENEKSTKMDVLDNEDVPIEEDNFDEEKESDTTHLQILDNEENEEEKLQAEVELSITQVPLDGQNDALQLSEEMEENQPEKSMDDEEIQKSMNEDLQSDIILDENDSDSTKPRPIRINQIANEPQNNAEKNEEKGLYGDDSEPEESDKSLTEEYNPIYEDFIYDETQATMNDEHLPVKNDSGMNKDNEKKTLKQHQSLKINHPSTEESEGFAQTEKKKELNKSMNDFEDENEDWNIQERELEDLYLDSLNDEYGDIDGKGWEINE